MRTGPNKFGRPVVHPWPRDGEDYLTRGVRLRCPNDSQIQTLPRPIGCDGCRGN